MSNNDSNLWWADDFFEALSESEIREYTTRAISEAALPHSTVQQPVQPEPPHCNSTATSVYQQEQPQPPPQQQQAIHLSMELQRILTLNGEVENPPRNNSSFGTKLKNVYQIVCEELGTDWRRFGCALGLRQGVLDAIEVENPGNVPRRIQRIFELFEAEECHDPNQHCLLICRALDKCYRPRLRQKVEACMQYC